jgi:hypothetical protein
MAFGALLDGGSSCSGPLLGAFESLRGGTPSTNPRQVHAHHRDIFLHDLLGSDVVGRGWWHNITLYTRDRLGIGGSSVTSSKKSLDHFASHCAREVGVV